MQPIHGCEQPLGHDQQFWANTQAAYAHPCRQEFSPVDWSSAQLLVSKFEHMLTILSLVRATIRMKNLINAQWNVYGWKQMN